MDWGASEVDAFVTLALDQGSWVHRRVESFRFQDVGATSVRVSLDYTIPKEHGLKSSADRVLVPIAWLAKGPIKRLDVRAADGCSVPVLTSPQHREIGIAVLTRLAGRRGGRVRDLDGRLDEVLRAPAGIGEPFADQLLKDLDWDGPGVTSSDDEELFEFMLLRMSEEYLLIAEVPLDQLGTRSLIKYSYEADQSAVLADGLPGELALSVPSFGAAASVHIEVELPSDLTILESQLTEERRVGGERLCDAEYTPSGIHHLVGHASSPFSAGLFRARLAVRRSATTRYAVLASLLAGAVSLGLVLATFTLPFFGLSSLVDPQQAALLVALVAAVLPLVGREPVHWLAAMAVRPFRRLAAFATSLTLAHAVVLAAVVSTTLSQMMHAALSFVACFVLSRAVTLERRVADKRYDLETMEVGHYGYID